MAKLSNFCALAQAGSSVVNLAASAEPSPALLNGLCRQHYATGDQASLLAAQARFACSPPTDAGGSRAVRKTAALAKVAEGKWIEAEKDWRALVDEDGQDLEVSLHTLPPFPRSR